MRYFWVQLDVAGQTQKICAETNGARPEIGKLVTLPNGHVGTILSVQERTVAPVVQITCDGALPLFTDSPLW